MINTHRKWITSHWKLIKSMYIIHCRNRNILIFGVDQFMTFYKFSELISSEMFNRQFKPIQYVKEKRLLMVLLNGIGSLFPKQVQNGKSIFNRQVLKALMSGEKLIAALGIARYTVREKLAF